ncbi:HECT-domain protein [Ancylostoma ceylanicum]|uniref:HECT-type E3 ubiquitin transferase n=1 Tax=Ancylostoma ceylanicum TaxID=53326 RepID=A0A0D6LFK3_9BILA|nr:HECT-domain protein [Ancylostoma ceylanicum]
MDTEGSARLRSRSKRTEDLDIRVSGVSASSSGSSMSQASSSSGSSTHLNVVPPLPAGWEACTDRRGRTFYIDHMSKKTTWQRPSATEIKDNEQIKRYSMNRRTVGMSPPTTPTYGPALFLQRPDFVSMLHENEAALAAYNASPIVKHIVHRIRKCGEPTEKYENNRDFVAFVNLFADDTQPLPMNWQASGRNPTVFIDHAARRTTLIDPRLPAPAIDRKRGRSAPPTRRQNLDKNGNLLDLASRTAEIALLVEERLPELAPKIRKKLRLIERLGAVALARLANDVDLITAISILDSDDQVVSSELEEKLNHFYASLHRSGYGKGPQKIKFRFSRSNLLNDAFEQILAADPVALRRARLSIAFDDEEGLDYGGPSRELFYLLSRELFHPYYGLFEYSAPDQYTVQISPHSHLVQQELQWMELAGRVLGLALLHRCLIDTFFTRTFYKMLLEQPVTVLDLQEVDPEFYRSMMWIRENPVDPSLGMTFVVSEEENGQVVEKELLPNGAELEVADQNKEEFISLMVKWRVERGIQRQSRALLRGLHQIIDRDFLRVFTVDQVELVLSGSREIDLEDWRKNTEYRGGYYDEHVVIEWFWDRVAQMSNADRLKLLQFVTGTSSIPFEGFAMLRGSNGPKRFTIEKWGEESALPRAHTCFNRLDLPSYPTRHILKAKLHTAIMEGINYAIE